MPSGRSRKRSCHSRAFWQAARSGGTGVAGRRGYDAAKRVVGRKRHALVDTDGRLLLAAGSPADLHDSHAGSRCCGHLGVPGP